MEKLEMMKDAYLMVKEYRTTYKLYQDMYNNGTMQREQMQNAFYTFCGACDMFKRLFKIDYFDARDIFEMTETPF